MPENSKLICYIATSLDGKIARPDGKIDWLEQFPHPEGEDYGYVEFYKTIDTVVMGRKTYEEILSFGVDWPYADCKSYIVSRQKNVSIETPNTELLNAFTAESLQALKRASKSNVWLVGGGQLVSEALRQGQLDQLIVSQIPVVIGEGLPLFPGDFPDTRYNLQDSKVYKSGVVILTYDRNV